MQLGYEDFPHLLSSEIEDRKGSRKGFEERELWYLLYGLAHAKANIKPAFSKVGDIRPQNVFINDKTQVKVTSLNTFPKEISNYSKTFENEVTYLGIYYQYSAPEELKQLEVGKIEGEDNNNCEVFSIGLTVLSAALLEDFSNLYDIKKYSFDHNQLRKKIDDFRVSNKYSDILKGVVTNLCEVTPEKRCTPEEMWAFLQPHGEKVRAKEDFVVENAPDKLHQQVAELREAMPLLMKTYGFIQQQPSYVRTQEVQQPMYQLESSPQVILHSRNDSQNKPGLNFPPPIIRTTVPEKYTELYQKYNSPERQTVSPQQPIQNSTQIESVYIPANQVPGMTSEFTNQQQNGEGNGTSPSYSNKQVSEEGSPAK